VQLPQVADLCGLPHRFAHAVRLSRKSDATGYSIQLGYAARCLIALARL